MIVEKRGRMGSRGSGSCETGQSLREANVLKGLPGSHAAEPVIQYQQRGHMERSAGYAKKTLDWEFAGAPESRRRKFRRDGPRYSATTGRNIRVEGAGQPPRAARHRLSPIARRAPHPDWRWE